jgi:hypothetical protein
VCAAGAPDEAGVAEAHDQLLEVGAGKVLFGRDLREAGRALAEVSAQLDHQPDTVLALGRERDGAAAMEGRADRGVGLDRLGQGCGLNPE